MDNLHSMKKTMSNDLKKGKKEAKIPFLKVEKVEVWNK